MIIRPARRDEMPRRLKVKWISVPVRFWSGVCVGCRIRAAWVMRRRPAELRSCGVLGGVEGEEGGETRAYWVGREEDEILGEDGTPDYCCQLLYVSRGGRGGWIV
jgi:hypothetical protein